MYLTIAELQSAIAEKTLIQLSNDDYQATTINTDVVQTAIDFAAQLIDGYLRGRHELPLAEPHTLLKQIAIDIARHSLYKRRHSDGKELPPAVVKAHEDAMKLLESIQIGKLHLGIVGKTPNDIAPQPAEFKVKSTQGVNTEGY